MSPCSGTLRGTRITNGSDWTILTSTTISCHDGMVIRALMKGNTIFAFVDNFLILLFSDNMLTTGKAGVEVSNTPAGNSISRVDLGPLDRIAPNNVNSGTLSVSAQPSRVDATWAAASDDANGVGVWKYTIYRSGVFILDSTTPSFTDLGV